MLRSCVGNDTSVQGTNDDAQISKMSCAKAGYFNDEFIQHFVRRASRRSPLINRGYYSRHAALRQLLEKFLTAAEASGQKPQVLVLGAGFDTTWFQIRRDKGRMPYKCLEVDFKEVTQRKAAIIAKEPALHSLLSDQHLQLQPSEPQPAQVATQPQPAPPTLRSAVPQPSPPPITGSPASHGSSPVASTAPPASLQPTTVETRNSATANTGAVVGCGLVARPGSRTHGPESDTPLGPSGAPSASQGEVQVDPVRGTVISPAYCLLPVDLRQIDALEAAIWQAGFDARAPTYVLSECVLVYMEPQHSTAVVRWAAGAFPNAVMAIYEQIRPDDAFGRQMVSNLEMRGCPLRGLPATPSLEAHCARLRDGGWGWADARDMDSLYRGFIPHAERSRAERLELFDELEEWHMIQEHYCIALGRNDADGWLNVVCFT